MIPILEELRVYQIAVSVVGLHICIIFKHWKEATTIL